MSDVTLLLNRWNRGDAGALKELLGVVHDESPARGEACCARSAPTTRCSPPSSSTKRISVSRACRRCVRGPPALLRRRREAMRRILVDHARQRNAASAAGRRGTRSPSKTSTICAGRSGLDFEPLDEALVALARWRQRRRKDVDLRYFAGLSIQETAGVLGIAPATVKRHWTFARAWLLRELTPLSAPPIRRMAPGSYERSPDSSRDARAAPSMRPRRDAPRVRDEPAAIDPPARRAEGLLAAHETCLRDRRRDEDDTGGDAFGMAPGTLSAPRRRGKDRRRRHGRSLPRRTRRWPLHPTGRREGHALDARAQRDRPALHHRAADSRVAQHRHIVQLLDGGTTAIRPGVPRHGARRRRAAHHALPRHAAVARRAAAALPSGLRRGAVRAPARHRPSRFEAGQHPRRPRRPKVVDFGVAKLLDGAEPGRSHRDRAGRGR